MTLKENWMSKTKIVQIRWVFTEYIKGKSMAIIAQRLGG